MNSSTASPDAARELLRVAMLVMRTLSAEMRQGHAPLAPTQMAALARVSEGPCTLSDLARHKAVSLSTISKSIDVLGRRGWVERCVDKHDRRQTMVRLTPKGRRALTAMKRRAERHIAEKLKPLEPVERAQLVSSLEVLTSAFVNK
jgi:MarR family transcriptional regulator, organic hydroperoxide resistance regulator